MTSIAFVVLVSLAWAEPHESLPTPQTETSLATDPSTAGSPPTAQEPPASLEPELHPTEPPAASHELPTRPPTTSEPDPTVEPSEPEVATSPPEPQAAPPAPQPTAAPATAAAPAKRSASGTRPDSSQTSRPDTPEAATAPPPAASVPTAVGSPDWMDALLPAPGTDDQDANIYQSDAADEANTDSLLPIPAELMARGPAVAWARFRWFIAALLVSQLCFRVARRRPRGPVRLFLTRAVALSRALATLAATGTVLALLPTKWLPWLGLVGASAAVAFGWSLRPLLSDGLAGLYLGIIGRHAPGTPVQLPDTRGSIHLPGPFRTVVRTESGALHTVPNRQLVTESRDAFLGGRTAITVSLKLPDATPPRSSLAAIQWACTLLPWTGEEPAKVRPPSGGSDASWTVEMVLLGETPPVDKVRAVFFDLVLAVLQEDSDGSVVTAKSRAPKPVD